MDEAALVRGNGAEETGKVTSFRPFRATSHLTSARSNGESSRLEGAIWRGFSPTEMVLPCVVLLGMGAVCFGLGVTILARKKDG